MKPTRSPALIIAVAAIALSACGPQGAAPAAPGATATGAMPAPAREAIVISTRGTITQIEAVLTQGETSGAGAVVGGLVGAAVGNQIGAGDGKKAATVVGIVGGAVVGHQVEKDRARDITGYRITVRLDDGSVKIFQQAQAGELTIGDRVNVDGGVVRRV
jgi:outer membrane lipoprotein SlyB